MNVLLFMILMALLVVMGILLIITEELIIVNRNLMDIWRLIRNDSPTEIKKFNAFVEKAESTKGMYLRPVGSHDTDPFVKKTKWPEPSSKPKVR